MVGRLAAILASGPAMFTSKARTAAVVGHGRSMSTVLAMAIILVGAVVLAAAAWWFMTRFVAARRLRWSCG